MRFPLARLLVLFTGAVAPLAVPACGARTGLVAPPVVQPRCVVTSTPPGTMDGCDGGATTSISGTVYDPAAKHPLYNVVVYVPGSTPQPITSGVSCDSCDELYTGTPLVTTLTDADGNFSLAGVPSGESIPLVIQVGKWRRQLIVPTVVACQDNPLPDHALTLPRNQSEGDLPRIAVSTGGADTLECLFRRVGIDASEYGGGADGAGAIHIFAGTPRPGGLGAGGGGGAGGAGAGGAGSLAGLHLPPNTSPPGPTSAVALWDSDADIERYDMVFLSCEGDATQQMNQQVLFDYAAAGGRVFAAHFHYAWFDSGPFGEANLASWLTGSNSIGNVNATVVTTTPGGGAFPQGIALTQWLANTGASVGGELPIVAARHNVNLVAGNTSSQPWIVADQNANPPGAVQYFTFNTPIGAAPAAQCGQVVYTDIHVGAASSDNPMLPVPEECADVDLSPQETALEFVLFNLSSCVTQPGMTPTPPPTCTPVKN